MAPTWHWDDGVARVHGGRDELGARVADSRHSGVTDQSDGSALSQPLQHLSCMQGLR